MYCNVRQVAGLAAAVGLTLASVACGGGSGTLTVLIEPEDVVIDGLQPGDGSEQVQDGWAVEFSRYAVAIGDIDVHLATDAGVQAEAAELFVVDLTQVPAAGLPLWTLADLDSGRYNFFYSTAGADDGASRHESVPQAEFDAMVAGGWTYLVEGQLSQTDGVSCPPAALATIPDGLAPVGQNQGGDDCYANPTVSFSFGADAETTFGPCEVDGIGGFTIADGATLTVAATIHGDHLFFNGFPEGSEGGVSRLAQWLADCDLDLNGEVTRAELEALAPADLPEIDQRFQLGGSPITPLTTMWDYVRAQLKTQGHYQGEGECPIDGASHDH